MGDRQDSAVGELQLDQLLHDLIGVVIDGGGGLIKDQNACLAQQRSRQTDQLPLSKAQVVAALGTLVQEPLLKTEHIVLQVRLLQHAPKLSVRVSPERVQIHSQASRKYDRILAEIQRLIPVSVRCKI